MPRLGNPKVEARQQMAEAIETHQRMWDRCKDMIDDLHDSGFHSVFLESNFMPSPPFHGFVYVWIDSAEINHERFGSLLEIAKIHNARVALGQPLGSGSRSLIQLWPRWEDDDA